MTHNQCHKYQRAYSLGWASSVMCFDEDAICLPGMEADRSFIDKVAAELVASDAEDAKLEFNNTKYLIRNAYLAGGAEAMQTLIKAPPEASEEWDIEAVWWYVRGCFDATGFVHSGYCPPVCGLRHSKEVVAFVVARLGLVAEVDGLAGGAACVNLYGTNAVDFLGEVYRSNTFGNVTCGVYRSRERRDCGYHAFMQMLASDCASRSVYQSKPPTLRVVRALPDAVIPCKARLSDVGFDLTVVKKGKSLSAVTALYDTGIKVAVPHGYYTEVVPRSSLSKSGYMLSNSVGVIDPSYTGSILIALTKVDPDAPEIELPFRCAQLMIRKQVHAMVEECSSLDDTARGSGGFGSTGGTLVAR